MEREKLTVTIKKDLFPKIDAIIDGRKIRNREKTRPDRAE